MKDTLVTIAYALMLIVLYFGSIFIAQELGKTITKDEVKWCQVQFNDSKANVTCDHISRLGN